MSFPCPFRLVVRWYLWISEQVMAKENNTLQWLDKSTCNERAPFSSLSCSAMAHFCVGVASQKFCRDYFSLFDWCPQNPQKLITLRNLYPYGSGLEMIAKCLSRFLLTCHRQYTNGFCRLTVLFTDCSY